LRGGSGHRQGLGFERRAGIVRRSRTVLRPKS
jgi:hypothetical protein